MPYYPPPFVIEANSVTDAMLADMPQGTLKGRGAGTGTSDPYSVDRGGLMGIINTDQVVLTKRAHIHSPDAGDTLNVMSTATGSIEGPSIALVRSTPPPVAMPLAVIRWYGKNSSDVLVEYGNFYSYLTNGAPGAETAEMRVSTKAGGAGFNPMRWSNGVCAGYPSGGFMGDGTINVGAYYAQGMKIADGAGINVGAIPDGSITSAKIAEGTIVSGDIAYNTIGHDRMASAPATTLMGRWPEWGAGPPGTISFSDVMWQLGQQRTAQFTHMGRVQFNGGVTGGNWLGTGQGSLGEIEVYQRNENAATMMCFHRPGWAEYFGIDGDRYWKVGGWSRGHVSHFVFHSGHVAWKALMEAAGDPNWAVTPGNMRHHPGVAKVWGFCDASGAAQTGYGHSSYNHYDTGIMRVHFAVSTNSGGIYASAPGNWGGEITSSIHYQDNTLTDVVTFHFMIGRADTSYWMVTCHSRDAG